MVFAEYPTLSLIIVVLCVLSLMYLLRRHAHRLMQGVSRFLYRQLRLLAQACLRTERRVEQRNREILKVLSDELQRRRLDREFVRLETLVLKDLAGYQTLASSINQQISAIDEDYEASTHVPELNPEWVSAVKAITSLGEDERNSETMARILADMHDTIKQHQRDVMREHRWTVNARHKLLSGLRSHWHKLVKSLETIGSKVDGLTQRLSTIDRQMERFEALRADSASGVLSSVLVRFFLALVFLAVCISVAVVNVQILLPPLQQLFVQSPDVAEGISLSVFTAALHLIMLLMAGVMVSECLRITHYFPLVTSMGAGARKVLAVLGGVIISSLALAEATLVSGQFITIPMAAVADGPRLVLSVIGFTAPVVIVAMVIPLEYFLHTLRPVAGSGLQVMLHIMALSMRMLGAMMMELGKLAVQLYDLVIFIPLRMESEWGNRRSEKERQGVVEGAEVKAEYQLPESPNVTAISFDSVRVRPSEKK